jgi:hypothetical protein
MFQALRNVVGLGEGVFMKSKFYLIAIVALATSAVTQAAPKLHCHDKDVFTPIEFTVVDDDVNGLIIKFEGLYSAQAIGHLGFIPAGGKAHEYRDLTITLLGQPQKRIHPDDHRVRHYSRFGLMGETIVQYRHKGELVEKSVRFDGLEITKTVTASRGVSYGLNLRLQHPGDTHTYTKNYYSHSCRAE